MDELYNSKGLLGSKFNNFEYKPNNDLWNSIYKNIDIHKPTGVLYSVFSDFHYYPRRHVWSAISNSIHPERKKLLIRKTLTVAAGLAVLVSSVFFLKNMQQNRNGIIKKQVVNTELKKSISTKKNELEKNNAFVLIKNDTTLNKDFLTPVKIAKTGDTKFKNLPDNESFKNKSEIANLIPVKALLQKAENDIIVLTKKPFLNINFEENKRVKSIGLNGMLAANLPAALKESDALASTGFDYLNNSNNVESDYSKEKQYNNITNYPPFTLGFVFNYNFSRRFSVSTGINYTRLSTYAFSEGNDWKSEYKSSKHYMGIPVNVNFKIIQQKKYTFFLFSGVQYDIGLLDKNKTTDYKNNEVLNEYITSSKFIGGQASYNFGFGTTYYLTKNFDLYLQTNLSHYFYLSHYNVWAEHKYWPGLQIGIRYNL